MRNQLRILAVISFSVLMAACGPFRPTEADKQTCLTVDDLLELGLEADVNRSAEKWFGMRNFGTRQLMYDYDEPLKQGGKQILFIQCQAMKQRTSVEAMATYQMQVLASKAIAISDIEEKRRAEGNCKGADACVLIDFHVKDYPVGNHFVVRSGAHVVSVTLLGPHFDDLKEWRELVAKKVEAIKRLE